MREALLSVSSGEEDGTKRRYERESSEQEEGRKAGVCSAFDSLSYLGHAFRSDTHMWTRL